MTNHLTPRAISFAMAVMMTLSMLAGIDALATEHAGNDQMARATVVAPNA